MIKTYEAYSSLEDADLENGDRVVIVYKDAKDYLKTGLIVSMTLSGHNKGDCTVLLDFENKTREYFHTNLKKIYLLVEYPSGEVCYVYREYIVELATTGLIRWDGKKQIYYFLASDRWQIEDFMI